MKRVLLLGVVLAVLAAGSAEARVGISDAIAVEVPRAPVEALPPTIQMPPSLAADIAAAVSYWGVPYPPLCLSATVSEAALTRPNVIAEATQPVAAGTVCEMRVRIGPDSPGERCRAIVHEYGHWLGLGHTDNKLDVMYRFGPYWANIPQCPPMPPEFIEAEGLADYYEPSTATQSLRSFAVTVPDVALYCTLRL